MGDPGSPEPALARAARQSPIIIRGLPRLVRLFEDAGERNVDIELDFRRGDNVLERAWATFVLA